MCWLLLIKHLVKSHKTTTLSFYINIEHNIKVDDNNIVNLKAFITHTRVCLQYLKYDISKVVVKFGILSGLTSQESGEDAHVKILFYRHSNRRCSEDLVSFFWHRFTVGKHTEHVAIVYTQLTFATREWVASMSHFCVEQLSCEMICWRLYFLPPLTSIFSL